MYNDAMQVIPEDMTIVSKEELREAKECILWCNVDMIPDGDILDFTKVDAVVYWIKNENCEKLSTIKLPTGTRIFSKSPGDYKIKTSMNNKFSFTATKEEIEIRCEESTEDGYGFDEIELNIQDFNKMSQECMGMCNEEGF